MALAVNQVFNQAKIGMLDYMAITMLEMVPHEEGRDGQVVWADALGMAKWAPAVMFRAIAQVPDREDRAFWLAKSSLEADEFRGGVFNTALTAVYTTPGGAQGLYKEIGRDYPHLTERACERIRLGL
jgi:hypothetical protein